MLEVPAILLLNCVGSYFFSIIEHLKGMCNGKGDNISLYYLAKGHLKYKSLNIENKKNPWVYQPMIIQDSSQRELEIGQKFYDFLNEKVNVEIQTVDIGNNSELLFHYIQNKLDDYHYFICNVDEYFIPSSTKFYGKCHNKHFLLIKEVDQKNKKLIIIDSEKNKLVSLLYEDIERAVIGSVFKKKECIFVDGSNYQDFDNVIEDKHNKMLLFESHRYFPNLIYDMQQKAQMLDSDRMYYYLGYYYTILSKVVPYYHMVGMLYGKKKEKILVKANELINQLNFLRNFMLFKSMQGDYSYSSVLKKIYNILLLENELYKEILNYQ